MQSFVQHYGYVALIVLVHRGIVPAFPFPRRSPSSSPGRSARRAVTGHVQFALWAVIVVGTLGSLVGSIIAYEVGRSAGRSIVDRWGKWLLLTHHGPRPVRAVVRSLRFGDGADRSRDSRRAQLHLRAGRHRRDEASPFCGADRHRLGRRGSRSSSALGYAAGKNWHHVSSDFHDAQLPIIIVVVAPHRRGLLAPPSLGATPQRAS